MCKEPRFRPPCESEHVKQFEKLHHSTSSDSFITLPKSKLENVLLSVSETLALFVNTLTTVDKYSLRNRKNLLQAIQQQLSKKQKDIFHVFAGYQKSTSHFEQPEKKNDLQWLCISEIRDCERFGWLNV